jgi:hypothetical protein
VQWVESNDLEGRSEGGRDWWNRTDDLEGRWCRREIEILEGDGIGGLGRAWRPKESVGTRRLV